MYAIQNVAKIAPKIAANLVRQPVRTQTFIASKPRQRMPKAEKYIHGAILLGVPMIIPVYMAMQFKHWSNAVEQ